MLLYSVDMSFRGRKIAFIILFPLISTVAIVVSIAINRRSADIDSRSQAGELEVEEISQERIKGIPVIITVAPQVAYEREPFSYTLKVVDSDSPIEDIQVRLVDAPEWLGIRDRFELYGIPVITGSTTQKVVVEVSDGLNRTDQTFYLVIQRADEN